MVHINTPRIAVITGAWPADPCQMCHFFFVSKRLHFSCIFLASPRRVLFGGFVKNLRHSELFFKRLLFHPCSHLFGGWATFPPCLPVYCGWLFPLCSHTSGKTEATWVRTFQFISLVRTVVVGGAHSGRPAGPNHTPSPRCVLMSWSAVLLPGEKVSHLSPH